VEIHHKKTRHRSYEYKGESYVHSSFASNVSRESILKRNGCLCMAISLSRSNLNADLI